MPRHVSVPVSDLAGFVAARLDEDVAEAKLAAREGGTWTQVDPVREPGRIESLGDVVVYDESLGDVVVYDEGSPDEYQAAHIARHDPARVLREVDAKRKILAEHPVDADLLAWSLGAAEVVAGRASPLSRCMRCTVPLPDACEDEDQYERVEWPCPTVRALAAVYSDHPDYRQEWAP